MSLKGGEAAEPQPGKNLVTHPSLKPLRRRLPWPLYREAV